MTLKILKEIRRSSIPYQKKSLRVGLTNGTLDGIRMLDATETVFKINVSIIFSFLLVNTALLSILF